MNTHFTYGIVKTPTIYESTHNPPSIDEQSMNHISLNNRRHS